MSRENATQKEKGETVVNPQFHPASLYQNTSPLQAPISRNLYAPGVNQAEARPPQQGQREAGPEWLVSTPGSKGMARISKEGPPLGIQSPSFSRITLTRTQPLM